MSALVHEIDRFIERERERCAVTWGHGEGPFYCDDSLIPWAHYNWRRNKLGEYFDARPAYGPVGYQVGTIPWLHCSRCDQRLSKVGIGARCGRENVAGTAARTENPPPCVECCKHGRLLCAHCCQMERAAKLSEECTAVADELNGMRTSLAFAASADPKNYCYFIEGVGSGLIKIGHTNNIKNRMASLVTMSPVELRLIALFNGGRVLEGALHSRLARVRAHGEWFRDGKKLRRALNECELLGCNEHGLREFDEKLKRLEARQTEARREFLSLHPSVSARFDLPKRAA